MRVSYLKIALALCGGVLIAIRCSPDSVAGGTSTSENGRITGMLVSGGAPASNARVTLVPEGHDPVRNFAALPAAVADAAGNYSFTRIARGDYVIQAVTADLRTRALIYGVHSGGDTVTRGADTMHIPGSITVRLPARAEAESAYVYIPGTTIYRFIGKTEDAAVLDSVPAGTVPSVVYMSNKNAVSPSGVRFNIAVQPDESVMVSNIVWKYNRPIRLNTSSSGADIGETLYGIPVLLRLNAANFDFSQCAAGIADVWITGRGDASVPYEIERWDDVRRVAEIWVRIDTLRGNDTSNAIMLYWGNRTAAVDNKSGRVFDTAGGFNAVWHMGESSGTLADATVNRYDCRRFGDVRQTDGRTGFGQLFNGDGAYCEAGSVLDAGSDDFTISAWVRRAGTGLQTIIAKSNGGTPSATYGWSLSFGLSDQLHCFVATGGANWGQQGAFDFYAKEDALVTDSVSWHYVVVVVDRDNGENCRTYIDGADMTGGRSGEVADVGALVNSLPLRIGAEADGDYQWTGSIDECRVERVARGSAWVRLCRVNQGDDDRLVEFR